MFTTNSNLQPLKHRNNDPRRPSPLLRNGATNYTQRMNTSAPAGALGGSNGFVIDMAGADHRTALFKDRYAQTEAKLDALFKELGKKQRPALGTSNQESQQNAPSTEPDKPAFVPKRAARTIDEDDYGDDDEGEEEEEGPANVSPLKSRSTGTLTAIADPSPSKPTDSCARPSTARSHTGSSTELGRSTEDVRKKLEEDKSAAEEAARRSFQTMFYTLESDRDAMLEQQRLDELDRQVETEMSRKAGGNSNANNTSAPSGERGGLNSVDMGASSLTFKHLIARIEAKRNQVRASDAKLRSLMSEVRKNRSKWASEDKIGQEELYESAESVLNQLKAMTEYAGPFLQRVNKREAPDYYNIIKHPMDFSAMLKKLKSLAYKSKKEFVDDLNLIWSNCLKYNADPAHYLRRKALYMRKETEKLVPLIPDITIRDRAEVEAEERRMQNGSVDAEGADDSDDEEPIMASRGRKAPAKKSKKGTTTARKAPPVNVEGTPAAETKPNVHALPNGSALRNDFLRADSDAPIEGSVNGLVTPPPGALTPNGVHGTNGSGAPGSQADLSEVDGIASSALAHAEESDQDDIEYKTWKQLTKKDRAMVAAERHRLFRGDKLNPEEPAVLRTKNGMHRWMLRQQGVDHEAAAGQKQVSEEKGPDQTTFGATLGESVEAAEERALPDYYDTVSAVPELNPRLRWVEDDQGQVIEQFGEFLRLVPKGFFTSPESNLTKKLEANMRQMQETRKIAAKIGIVKQMQLQSQMYQNQFQKYDPQPFVEADIEPCVISDEGPVMAPWVCRAALQRSVSKLFYSAGFEEFQPSALEAVTDIASDYFMKLVRTLGVYREAPKVLAADSGGKLSRWKPKFTKEEAVLHTLHVNGYDIEELNSYVTEDIDRTGTKLSIMHDRMKSHLAELLRPALDPNAGTDGAGAFSDGSDQFVGGDFAEDIDVDFFGFRELGLDKEFGLASLSVPLHLLQNRMYNAAQANNTNAHGAISGIAFEPPPPYPPLTAKTIKQQIRLVQDFFTKKLQMRTANADGSPIDPDAALIEDDELPTKQRFPKPRLPPTGKISSPRKRPLREQQMMAKKRRKLDENGKAEDIAVPDGVGVGPAVAAAAKAGLENPGGGLKLRVPDEEKGGSVEPEKESVSAVGMMSPESMEP